MTTLPIDPTLSRPRKKANEWQELISQFEQSDLTRKQFCAEHALVLSTFDYWRHKLRQAHKRVSDESVFVALTSDPEAASSDTPPWDVELQLDEHLFLRLRHPC